MATMARSTAVRASCCRIGFMDASLQIHALLHESEASMQQRPDVRQTRPFGYWVKHIDQRIEEMGRRVLAGEGLNRRFWQVLNTNPSRPIRPGELDPGLAPLISDDAPTMPPYPDKLPHPRRGPPAH